MFGAYEFFQTAGKTGVKPIIGIEAYVAPESRFHKKQVFWGGSGRGQDASGEGGKDVSGGGRYTHMTMWAQNAQGLRNLFRLSSLASFEGYYMKPRMDRELISQYASGIIATTGCPSGEVQTRLRLGQYDEAVKAAATYQDIFGKENYFLELMDHGLDIERSVREDLLRIAKQLNIPLLATNDSHYVTEDQADDHDSLLCVGVGKNKADTNRFKFNGTGYYIKTSAEMRQLFSELPEACDNTLLIAERVESYKEVFAYEDQMPQFAVPEGETQASWLRKECERGIKERYGDNPDPEVLERLETELSVITPMGFDSYFLVVSDICKYGRDNGVPVGPGRGSAAGSLVAYLTRITDVDPLKHGLLFERFLNPERINPPDVDLDFDDRQRDVMVRYLTDKYGEAYTAQVNTFGTIKAKAAVKDANRILGFPFSMGDRITKAMPPDVMGKGIPLSGIFDPEHPRYSEASEIRSMYENEPDVKKIIDTARGIEGLTRGTGVHAAAVILSRTPLLDLIPMHKRDRDGTIITGFSYPDCEEMGLIKMDFLGLRNLGIIDHAIKIIKENRGIEVDTSSIELDDKPTYELLARGDTLGVFQLDGTAMRSLLRLMQPDRFDDISAVLALYRPGPMGVDSHTNYALRKIGRQEITPIHPELEEPLREVLDPTYGLIVYQEQVQKAAQILAGYSLGQADLLRRAMGKKKPEVLAKEFVPFQKLPGARLLGRGDPGRVGRPGPLLRLRVQQVAHRRLRHGRVLDRLPEGQLPRRVHGGPAHLGRQRQGQDRRLPGRVPPARHQDPLPRRERVRRRLLRHRRGRPLRPPVHPQRRRQRHRVPGEHPQVQGQVHLLRRLPRQVRDRGLQQAHHRLAHQGRRLRLPGPHPQACATSTRPPSTPSSRSRSSRPSARTTSSAPSTPARTPPPSVSTSPSATRSGTARPSSPWSARCSACTSPPTPWTAPSTSWPAAATPPSPNCSAPAAPRARPRSPA